MEKTEFAYPTFIRTSPEKLCTFRGINHGGPAVLGRLKSLLETGDAVSFPLGC